MAFLTATCDLCDTVTNLNQIRGSGYDIGGYEILCDDCLADMQRDMSNQREADAEREAFYSQSQDEQNGGVR